MKRLLPVLALLAGLSGCLQHVMHQGNVLKPGLVLQIREGDTRFRVESLLGTPVLQNVLTPNRATYIEDYYDPETGKAFRRSIDIIYDDANRVASIKLKGFGESDQKK